MRPYFYSTHLFYKSNFSMEGALRSWYWRVQILTILWLFAGYLPRIAAQLHDNLERRQAAVPSQCDSQCSQITQAVLSCQNDACLCPVIQSQGSICYQCLQTLDSSMALILSTGISQCNAETLVGIFPTQCNSQCASVTATVEACIDDACYCPIILAAGPTCSSCLDSFSDPTDASFIQQQIAGCISEFPYLSTGPYPTITIPPCAPYCEPIDQAIATCSFDACLCPIVLASGPACSNCWATASAAEASVVASLIEACATETSLLQ